LIRRAALCDAAAISGWIERDSSEAHDLTPLLNDPLNVVLLSGEGGAMFLWRGPGIYEVHVFFAERGREVIRVSRQMLEMMRSQGAKMFWAAVPIESRRVIMFTRLMGWKSNGVREFPHGYCEIFSGE
jgi:hypothetical protein